MTASVPFTPGATLVIVLLPALIPPLVMLGPVGPPTVKPLPSSTLLPTVTLSRSFRLRASLTFSSPFSSSTRRFVAVAASVFAKSPLILNVSLSFLLIVAPWLPANFKPSFRFAICCGPVPSLYSIRVVVSPGCPFTPAGPCAPVIEMPGVPGCPFTPGLPFSVTVLVVTLSVVKFLSN